MKFSIVTISYNQSKYLKQCIDSVVSQDVDDLEYIVVDPGSADESRKIIDSYEQIIKMYSPDKGPADGLNNGFELATGDYCGFINADDYLLPGALKKIQEEIKKNSAEFISGKGIVESLNKQSVVSPSVLTLDDLLYRSAVIFQQSTFFSRDLFFETNGFNPDNHTCWDYELYVEFLANGARHMIVEELLSVFRIYPGSITGSGRLNRLYEKDLDRIFRKYKHRDYNIFDLLVTLRRKFENSLA